MLVTAKAAADAGDEPEQYVINLCASTTPMALVQPKTEALRRFTFFVSRRREDGRERFRLHMGYFTSPGEAEEWLAVVRELYPAAWVGEAPGKKLRAAARAAAAAAATPEPAAPEVAAPAPAAPTAAAPAAAPPEPPIVSPPAPVAAPVTAPAATPPAVAALSNVREVLAQLEATDPPRPATPHMLYVPPPPVLPEHIPTVQALTPPPMPAPPAMPQAVAPPPAPTAPPAAAPPLSDTQVLRVLEDRRATGASPPPAPTSAEREANAAIELLRPEDTRTMRALKEDVQRSAPMQFAVQLTWSVTPIDLESVPPLAIFSAYTLYTAESTRDGRKWYGLRLGFFSDALSAKQVAYYVRSDFTSVAVVPVTSAEKDNAIAGAGAQALPVRKTGRVKKSDEFKLFDVDPVPARPAPTAAQVHRKLAAAAAATQAGKRPGAAARATAPPRRKARSLEESLEQTLEILGASELEIDKGRGELLNDSGVRHLSVKVDKRTSTFSKLLERLSDRVGKS